ncbi:MAG: alpha amylase C-terminal domain-containing protein [Clostridia bacterium]|nr:alpha amylase C-terminal domain-containing protein [Clostridia bacterium]
MKYRIMKYDPYLAGYSDDINLRMDRYYSKRAELLCDKDITEIADCHKYFGIHRTKSGWVYREWAPGADKMFLTGDFNGWDMLSCPMEKKQNGVFEIALKGKNTLKVGQYIQAIVEKDGKNYRRVPAYATRVLQDKNTYNWCAVVDDVLCDGFEWTDEGFKPASTPIIYECHIGMAQEEYKVGTYNEFTEKILPRIKKLGYNTIQIMAIMEHPYYASFGYQVSNFFAPSSRFGSNRDLKNLINTAHSLGITVLLDVVHSHAVSNTGDGLNEFDGTDCQYFHQGSRGNHIAWGTKLFDYSKNEVLSFLLSNLKYWMEVFHFDGFRFDGVTSMLYHDHGLESAFCNYDMYFSPNTDIDSITYLQLANELVHKINPKAITIAEDMSGMPGMCLKIGDGGIGFDYRLSMGVPDMWIKYLKEYSDENWDMHRIWYELTTRRPKEKNIGYCESHDQALVGDKTIMFRLCDADMYNGMSKDFHSYVIDRGMALHKIIRLITASVAGEGYLNFMGNEFGHPEWIDFPREGNGYSHHYCRRQWSLVDNDNLKYQQLNNFDAAMVGLLKKRSTLKKSAVSLWTDNDNKIIIYEKNKYVFAFNFNPQKSFEKYFIPTNELGSYSVTLSTDEARFGGFDRIDKQYVYTAKRSLDGKIGFLCYLPSRTAVVFEKEK